MKNIAFLTSSFNKKNIFNVNYYKKKKIELRFNKLKKTLNFNELKKLLDHNTIGILSGNELLNKLILQSAPNLKIISRCGVGIDNIDLDYAKKKKIMIKNTPLIPSIATAEFTVAVVLSLIKNLYENIKSLKEKKWTKFKGKNVQNKTIGIIGYGNVGSRVAKFLSFFGSKILVYDIKKVSLFKKVTLSKLLKTSNVIILTCSLTKETINLLNKNNLCFIKKNSIIVNSSRGGIINEKDLFLFLKKNKSVKAFSDCFVEEPYKGELLDLNNFYSTAHVGSFTEEARNEMERISSLNLFKQIKKIK